MGRLSSTIRLCLAASMLALSLWACNNGPRWDILPLPELPSEPLLRVAYVENPRFPGAQPAMLRAILDKTRQLVKQHFGIELVFAETIERVDIAGFFDNLKPVVRREGRQKILDPERVSTAQRRLLHDSLYQTMENYTRDRQQVLDFARPYLLKAVEDADFHKLADALVETLLQRLRYWREQKAADGRPVLDGSPYNEWVWWDTLGYGNVPHDVVITNQLIASAEFYGMDVHSSLRGGITAGTTTYSHHAQFRSYSWISLYPLLNDSALLQQLRGDERYSEQQVIDYAAAMLAHELGHLLLHLGHPFGNPHCIMAPMPLLRYREWYAGLDASRCTLGSSPQMTPGAAKIEYRSNW